MGIQLSVEITKKDIIRSYILRNRKFSQEFSSLVQASRDFPVRSRIPRMPKDSLYSVADVQ